MKTNDKLVNLFFINLTFLQGLDKASMGLSYALLLLAEHENIQVKVVLFLSNFNCYLEIFFIVTDKNNDSYLALIKLLKDKSRNEINHVFEKSGGKFGYFEIQQLVYLEVCMKESLF